MKIIQKKICLLGDFAVGKTSLVRQFVEGRFDEKYLSTIGVMVSRKSIARETHTLNLIIWDLVGGSEFANREVSYLAGSAGAMIVCDLTRPETLETLHEYARRVRVSNPNIALVMVGNKLDLTAERRIGNEQLTAVRQNLQSEFFLTSAKTAFGVEAAFQQLAYQLEGSDDRFAT